MKAVYCENRLTESWMKSWLGETCEPIAWFFYPLCSTFLRFSSHYFKSVLKQWAHNMHIFSCISWPPKTLSHEHDRLIICQVYLNTQRKIQASLSATLYSVWFNKTVPFSQQTSWLVIAGQAQVSEYSSHCGVVLPLLRALPDVKSTEVKNIVNLN